MGHAPSTLWQYRWAWSQIELFCSSEGGVELTDDVVASFLRFVAAEHREGRIKEWKRRPGAVGGGALTIMTTAPTEPAVIRTSKPVGFTIGQLPLSLSDQHASPICPDPEISTPTS